MNTPVNHSVVFVKESEGFFTSGYWTVVIHIPLSPYIEAVETLQYDLTELQKFSQFPTVFAEINRVKAAVNLVASKLSNIKVLLPTSSKRRGLINAGGSILKFLLGTALDSDVTDLQSKLDAIQHKQSDVIHAVNQQITVFKQTTL
jgi:hypothetical protein